MNSENLKLIGGTETPMRSIIASSLILFAFSAHGWPGAGNWDEFQITSENSRFGTVDSQIRRSEYLEFDPEKGKVKLKVTTRTLDGKEWISYQEQSGIVQSRQSLASMLRDCELYYGLLETLTVPAGTFTTCRVQSTGAGVSVTWYSEIGEVQSYSAYNNMKSTWQLLSYGRVQ